MENPWTLLSEDLGADVIPAIGDYNSAMWILHKQLGDDIVLQNEMGGDRQAEIGGLAKDEYFSE